MITVIFVLFPGVTQLDMTGPAQVLSRLPRATTLVAAASLDPVMTDSGFAIVPTTTFAEAPPADIICVPGGHGVADALGDAATIDFVARQAAAARWVTSVCTGAFFLGRAGLLEGKRATTHWAYAHLLPLVGAVHAPGRVVEDGHTITAGGVTAGIDFALTLIAREAGESDRPGDSAGARVRSAPAVQFGHAEQLRAPERTDALKKRVYDEAAARMAAALGSVGGGGVGPRGLRRIAIVERAGDAGDLGVARGLGALTGDVDRDRDRAPVGGVDDADVARGVAERAGLVRDLGARRQHAGNALGAGLAALHRAQDHPAARIATGTCPGAGPPAARPSPAAWRCRARRSSAPDRSRRRRAPAWRCRG